MPRGRRFVYSRSSVPAACVGLVPPGMAGHGGGVLEQLAPFGVAAVAAVFVVLGARWLIKAMRGGRGIRSPTPTQAPMSKTLRRALAQIEELSIEQDAQRMPEFRAAVDAGFVASFGQEPTEADVTLAAAHGVLVIDGKQVGADGRSAFELTQLGEALSQLVILAEEWLPGDSRDEKSRRFYELLASAWRGSTGPVTRNGPLALHRVDLAAPIASRQLTGPDDISVVDLLTWEISPGRHRLLAFYPVSPDSGYGPAASGAYPLDSVVRIRRADGRDGSGVVIRAAAAGRPALVLTALHVVADGQAVSVAGRPITAWVSIAVDMYGTGQPGEVADAAMAAFEAVNRVGRVESVDLALVEVDGLDAPAMPVGQLGEHELGAVDGFPWQVRTPAQGWMARLGNGYVRVSVLSGPGVSGGPGINAAGALVGIVSYGRTHLHHLVGPILIHEFLRLAVPILDSGVRIPAPGQPGSEHWFGQDRPQPMSG